MDNYGYTHSIVKHVMYFYPFPRVCVHLCAQVIELPVSERDVEKEHLAQLRRWKDMRGELHCKSPPRMHGARAIMSAEPPSRQDLRQHPTIIVESPVATVNASAEGSAEDKKAKKGRKKPQGKEEKKEGKEEVEKNERTTDVSLPPPPPADLDNPYPALAEPEDTPSPLGSLQSLSSTEHDTYL